MTIKEMFTKKDYETWSEFIKGTLVVPVGIACAFGIFFAMCYASLG